MKRMIKQVFLLMTILCLLSLYVYKGNAVADSSKVPYSLDSEERSKEMNTMIAVSISVGNKVFSAKFHNNESAKAIIAQMPFTLEMRDFSGQEKVNTLPFALPRANTIIPSRINAGEIYIWSGNQLAFFYMSFPSNVYSYVPVGFIEDTNGLTQALGNGNATITFHIE